jgi:hypothetical protein
VGTTELGDGVERVQLAAQAYIYGYPLVYNLHEIDGFANNIASLPFSAPYNQFGYARELLGPETEFVSPNNDTLYVLAACDVREGPLVLHVPDTAGRYYVLQFVDAWTNNFAYIGRRATGTSEGEFLLAADGWAGKAPGGMQLVSAPTGIFMIVGRVQVDGEADLPAVHALQDQFTITPLSVREGGRVLATTGAPKPDPRVREDLQWWERLRSALISFPPAPADARFVEVAARLGATAAESRYVNPDPALAEALVAGAAAGQQKIEELMQGAGQDAINGWNSAMHGFDYNLDHLGLGTLDRPDWKIQDRTEAYATRAAAARGGLWGNHGYEAAYAMALDGRRGRPARRCPQPLRTAILAAAPGRCVLVADDVRRLELLPRGQRDRTLLNRRPDRRTRNRRRRVGDHLHPAGCARHRQALELATDARREVPPADADVPATRGDPQRRIHPARHHQGSIDDSDEVASSPENAATGYTHRSRLTARFLWYDSVWAVELGG